MLYLLSDCLMSHDHEEKHDSENIKTVLGISNKFTHLLNVSIWKSKLEHLNLLKKVINKKVTKKSCFRNRSTYLEIKLIIKDKIISKI